MPVYVPYLLSKLNSIFPLFVTVNEPFNSMATQLCASLLLAATLNSSELIISVAPSIVKFPVYLQP